MEETALVVCLAALAQPMRLHVFRALVTAGSGGMVPGELARSLDAAPATLSFHLKELARAGLVTQQRDGRHLIYRASLAQVGALLAYLKAHCCPGAASPDACLASSGAGPPGATAADAGQAAETPLPAAFPPRPAQRVRGHRA